MTHNRQFLFCPDLTLRIQIFFTVTLIKKE